VIECSLSGRTCVEPICKRSNGRTAVERVDFSGFDLTDANFAGSQLAGVRFAMCDLTRADFSGANLAGADFNQARLICAIFSEADLSGASFQQAVMDRCEMGGLPVRANESARTAGAIDRFPGANFRINQLGKTVFRLCDLTQANFEGLDLQDCDFGESDLAKANLQRRTLTARGATRPISRARI